MARQDSYSLEHQRLGEPLVIAELIESTTADPASRSSPNGLPTLLFLVTCVSTWWVGGWAFALALMSTLTAHEMGHFLQARRYRVPASWPYFIPMPFNPVGTMGALIVMEPGRGDRKALFDIAISGPLAGIVMALIYTVIGLSLSEVTELEKIGPTVTLGEPLIFQGLVTCIFGPLTEGQDVLLHPVAFAGWVGIFITALNLIPIGQLDGGHILYALLRKRAHPITKSLLVLLIVLVVFCGYYGWALMLFLLILMGPSHPPTADDSVPLSGVRRVLGWLSLGFVVIGFTPMPFVF